MKKKSVFLGAFLFSLLQFGCSKEDLRIDNPGITDENVIQDFIWEGMNLYYLWQESVPNLEDDRFLTNSEYVNFLNDTPKPEDFFENLIFDRNNVDFWSWIVDDYEKQDQQFQGISLENGVDFSLFTLNSNTVYGYVRIILPNSDASDKNIKRGDVITHVNDTRLSLDNYRSLLFNQSNPTYILGLGKMEDGIIVSTGVNVELTKTEYVENPVFISKTINQNGHKIGYIMYNWFTRNFDNELNEAFLQFKNENITDLVVDLRYNPGGFVSSALALSGMITGQFKGELFFKEEWNSKWQNKFLNNDPESLVVNFTDKLSNNRSINSLGLNKVHFIVTGRSASASELVISSLKPYLDVRLVGTRTVGKYVASTTLYDSDNFSKSGINPNHTYAIQPIIYKTVNKLGESAKGGFEPQIILKEDIENLGVLGEVDEPLLNAAIADIIGASSKEIVSKKVNYQIIGDSKMNSLVKNNMFVEINDMKNLLKSTRNKSN